MIYRVEIEPDGKYWNISVPQIQRVTQARTLGEVESMAKDLISIMTEEPDPQIEVQMHLPSQVEEALRLKSKQKKRSGARINQWSVLCACCMTKVCHIGRLGRSWGSAISVRSSWCLREQSNTSEGVVVFRGILRSPLACSAQLRGFLRPRSRADIRNCRRSSPSRRCRCSGCRCGRRARSTCLAGRP